MKVMIAVASRHGSTREIAEEIARVLEREGHEIDVVDAEPDRWLDDEHDAYLVGSGVYFGNWLRSARKFVTSNRQVLAQRPTWLFSSGPLGADGEVGIATGHLSKLLAPLRAVEHRVFRGRLDRNDLNLVERAVVRGLRAPSGDFRNWNDVEVWALEISAELNTHIPIEREPEQPGDTG